MGGVSAPLPVTLLWKRVFMCPNKQVFSKIAGSLSFNQRRLVREIPPGREGFPRS